MSAYTYRYIRMYIYIYTQHMNKQVCIHILYMYIHMAFAVDLHRGSHERLKDGRGSLFLEGAFKEERCLCLGHVLPLTLTCLFRFVNQQTERSCSGRSRKVVVVLRNCFFCLGYIMHTEYLGTRNFG